MGTSLAADPAAYEPMHLDYHAWMLTGGTNDGTTYVEGTSGVQGLVEGLTSATLGVTPYTGMVAYNPIGYDQPLANLKDVIETQLSGLNSMDRDTDWVAHFNAAKAAVEDTLSDATISAMVTAYENDVEAKLATSIANIKKQYSAISSLNSTGQLMAIAILEAEKNREVADFSAKLNLDKETSELQIAAGAADRLTEIDYTSLASKSAFVSAMLQFTDMYITANRQYQQDELTLKIEDAFWDIKLYDFAGKALSAISGASVIPSAPNAKLETLSSISSSVGALSPLLIAAYKQLT